MTTNLTSIPRTQQLESTTQKAIVEALQLAGWTVLSTSARKQRAPSGVSKGVPDLLVSADYLGAWLGLEVKRPGPVRWSCPEQMRLNETGMTCVVQSVEDALRYAIAFALRMRSERMAVRTEAVLAGLRA